MNQDSIMQIVQQLLAQQGQQQVPTQLAGLFQQSQRPPLSPHDPTTTIGTRG